MGLTTVWMLPPVILSFIESQSKSNPEVIQFDLPPQSSHLEPVGQSCVLFSSQYLKEWIPYNLISQLVQHLTTHTVKKINLTVN